MTAPTFTRWRPSAPVLRTIGLMVAAFFSLTGAIAAAQERAGGTDKAPWLVAIWLVALLGVAVLPWRHRWPVPFALATSLASVVLPIDGPLPLVGLYATLLVASELTCVAVGFAASCGVAVSIWRDSAGHGADPGKNNMSSLWRPGPNPTAAHYAWWQVLLITAVLVGVVIALGLLGRSRKALQHSETRAREATATIDLLGEQVARQQERERIAREVHDVLGHRLSLLALHAGAVEVATSDNPDAQRSAKLVRESAQQAMGDLRSLLAVLRQPDSPDMAAPVLTLRDLPALVNDTTASGVPISSSIYVDESAPLGQLLSHSAYRITQELLTNARRHGDNGPIALTVQARPDTGISIATTNHAPGLIPHGPVRAGNGLNGIHERVRRCGGESWAWIDNDSAFRCLVRLPWTSDDRTPAKVAP